MIYFILLFALALRLVVINQSLWLDEAIGAIVAKTFTFTDIILKFPLTDNHPPLYYLVLRAWTQIFGFSEVSLRLPSVIFGVLTVLLVYKIAKNFTKANPIIPTLLLATSPLHIYYSQEARMYSMAAFLATGAIYFFLQVIKNEKNTVDWIIFTLFYTALAFSDYLPAFLYPVFFIYPIIKKIKPAWWKKFAISNIPLAVLGFLWLPIFRIQGEKGKWLLATLPGWREVAGGATIKQLGVFWSKFVLGRISFFNKTLYYSLIFAASLPILGLLTRTIRKIKENSVFWLWFAVPVVLGFLASFLFPAFIYFRFIFVLPAFYLLIALGKNKFLIYAVLVFNLIGWGIYTFDATQHREDWRGAASYIGEAAGPNEIAIFENTEPFAPYRWYDKGRIPAYGATDSISANPDKTEAIVKKLTAQVDGIYYFEYLKPLQDPQGVVVGAIIDGGFVEVERKAFNGVGFVIHFEKKEVFAYGGKNN
ncbi:MAG TPA: glycosyltransferase family 39 protein [Patescibacteria group bacterium]|nr:glycosyltransferase family 39 protein [Patescibacteria group bacterium]